MSWPSKWMQADKTCGAGKQDVWRRDRQQLGGSLTIIAYVRQQGPHIQDESGWNKKYEDKGEDNVYDTLS